jgi:hypothetical protein
MRSSRPVTTTTVQLGSALDRCRVPDEPSSSTGKRSSEQGGQSQGIIDLETGEKYWISGIKKRGSNRHRAGSGKVTIQASAVEEYLSITGAKVLERPGS